MSGCGILALVAAFALACCQWLIYVYAPLERSMGLVQKILYLHLPMAWWSLASFFVVFVAGIAYLKTRKHSWDSLASAAAEIGVLLATLALASGSIWARHSWGVWWAWDPRLTTTLVMWLLYVGYLILRGQDMVAERKAMICAVFGIVAFADVPLVFLSARLWRSIHPTVFASQGGGMDPQMRLTALGCVLCFGLFWAAMLCLRTQQIRHAERVHFLENEGNDDV